MIVTGDVVMGYDTRFFSKSVQSQWDQYRTLWESQQTVSRENWLDVPGNHDYTMQTSADFIREQFAQKHEDNGVFSVIENDESRVCLLGLDTSYLPRAASTGS